MIIGDEHEHGDDEHGDRHVPSESYPHVQGGPAVLDIGGDIGAMIVTMDPDAVGTELHLRSAHAAAGLDSHRSLATGPRRGGATTTAVFAELREGRYWVLDSAGNDLRHVEIRGGALTSIDLTRLQPANARMAAGRLRRAQLSGSRPGRVRPRSRSGVRPSVNHQRRAKKRSAPTAALTATSAIVPDRPSGWASSASTSELAPSPARLVIRPTSAIGIGARAGHLKGEPLLCGVPDHRRDQPGGDVRHLRTHQTGQQRVQAELGCGGQRADADESQTLTGQPTAAS